MHCSPIKNCNYTKTYIAIGFFLSAVTVQAQDFSYVSGGLGSFLTLLGELTPLFVGLALAIFIWSVISFMRIGKESAQSEARGGMLWGIFILFIMVSVWGIVKLLQDTFSVDGDVGSLQPPAPLDRPRAPPDRPR